MHMIIIVPTDAPIINKIYAYGNVLCAVARLNLTTGSAGIVDDVLRLLVDQEVEESARKAAGATLKNLAGSVFVSGILHICARPGHGIVLPRLSACVCKIAAATGTASRQLQKNHPTKVDVFVRGLVCCRATPQSKQDTASGRLHAQGRPCNASSLGDP